MLDLGKATLEKIVDLDPFALPLRFILPDADPAALRHAEAVLAPDHVDFAGERLLLGVHSLLLRTSSLTVLIDTCIGEHKPRPRRADWHERTETGFLERLAAAGVRPDEIDLVFCTHLHADHVGWNTRRADGRWVPTFPNARYLIGRAELADSERRHAEDPTAYSHGAYADSVLPVVEAGLVETVDDGFEIAPGLTVEALPGHTAGQIGLCLACGGGRQAFFCGDAIHSPVQVYEPGWASAFCHDRDAAVATRLGLLERSAETDALLIPAHLRRHAAMRVERRGGGYRPVFA